MRKIDTIILHCSATAEGKDYKASDIKRWHLQQGWSDIGYHYVIDLDGTIETGRALALKGAHCTGHNATSIGICYIGGLASDGKTAKDTRTQAQKVAMINLVAELMEIYHLPLTSVRCHNEYAAKACPSFRRDKFVSEFNFKKKI